MEYIKTKSKPKDGKLLAVGHSMGGILLYAMLSRCCKIPYKLTFCYCKIVCCWYWLQLFNILLVCLISLFFVIRICLASLKLWSPTGFLFLKLVWISFSLDQSTSWIRLVNGLYRLLRLVKHFKTKFICRYKNGKLSAQFMLS